MAGSCDFDIAVVGAGPAGAAVALGLMRLGYAVTVIGVPRTFAACEGISGRALRGLAEAGLGAALVDVPAASPRSVYWNGEQRPGANTEHLVLRREFDLALRAELQRAGLSLLGGRVNAIKREPDGRIALQLEDRRLHARLVVDARGRAAPRGRGQRLRGPETVSLLQHWTGPRAAAGSCALSLADGWAWLARCADGQRYTQLTLAADAPDLPKRSALAACLRQRLDALPVAADWIGGCVANGAPIARSSTAILQAPLIDRGVIRVGDAAMAVDPLSGNGIFQALSSASVAPAVINTLLRDPDSAALAERFYGERVAHIFTRFARIGRDFHRTETRWSQQPFWSVRGQWPDDEPAHDSIERRLLGLALRPVVDNGFIREREVVLSSDQPLGVWRVAGVEVAPLLHGLPQDGAERDSELLRRITALAGNDSPLAQALKAWFSQYLRPAAVPG